MGSRFSTLKFTTRCEPHAIIGLPGQRLGCSMQFLHAVPVPVLAAGKPQVELGTISRESRYRAAACRSHMIGRSRQSCRSTAASARARPSRSTMSDLIACSKARHAQVGTCCHRATDHDDHSDGLASADQAELSRHRGSWFESLRMRIIAPGRSPRPETSDRLVPSPQCAPVFSPLAERPE